MKISIDGKPVYEATNPDSIEVVVDLAEKVEMCGPIKIKFQGGWLRVRPDGGASLTVIAEGNSGLSIGESSANTLIPHPYYDYKPPVSQGTSIVGDKPPESVKVRLLKPADIMGVTFAAGYEFDAQRIPSSPKVWLVAGHGYEIPFVIGVDVEVVSVDDPAIVDGK